MLLEAWLEIVAGWKKVSIQRRTARRAGAPSPGLAGLPGPSHTVAGDLDQRGRTTQLERRVLSHSRAEWDPQQLFVPILERALAWCPGRLVGVAVDDTRLRKTGLCIPQAFYQRDPLSPPFHWNLMRGLRFLQASLLLPLHRRPRGQPRPADPVSRRTGGETPAAQRFVGRVAGVPGLVKQHNLSQRFRQMLGQLRQMLDRAGAANKLLVLAADGSFCNRTVFSSPRFRLVFIMGFTFGVAIFLPTMLRHGAGAISPHRLTMVSAYSLLILGDVVFWNIFGFDRSAAQLYFLTPCPISMALAGKNVAAAIFVLLEVTGVGVVWALLRMPMDPDMLVEAYAVAVVLSLYLLGAGNLASVSYPRPVNPERSTGAVSSGRARVILLLAYPALALPVLLAYGAEYAFRSRPAFYVVLAFAAALGAAFYWVALGSAAARSERCREQFLDTLSQSEGPVSLG